jgi:hypothetical protein
MIFRINLAKVKVKLDPWNDADPGIAEVDDARARLTGLKEYP